MTPSARFAAAVELLGFIEAAPTPADQHVTAFFRARRYAGSKDRRWVSEFVYRCLRRKGELDWYTVTLEMNAGPRTAALLSLVLFDEIDASQIADDYFGGTHGLDALNEQEVAALSAAASQDKGAMPDYSASNFPEWVAELLKTQYSERAEPLMASYQQRAPVTMRINSLKTDREEAQRLLAVDDIEVSPTIMSPDGLILKSRQNISRHALLDQGLAEMQDEAAQIASRLADVQPGMQVVDYCAGGGGKSLALAALMRNEGAIQAFDTSARRMRDIKSRSRRATVDIIAPLAIAGDDSDAELLAPLLGQIPRVFVDAPCSGSGTWRRQPDQKWTLTDDRLAELMDIQQDVMSRASDLVALGGRLIYATCSIFKAENEDQVAAFLERHGDFKIVPVSEIWDDAGLGGQWESDFLTLTPLDFGSDGFFTAVLERTGYPE